MAEAGNSVQQEEASRQENPILSFFSNLLASIKLPFLPNFGSKKDAKIQPADASSLSQAESVEIKPVTATEEGNNSAPDVVVFPRQTYPQLTLEAEDAERNTNPIILWQVYAIGGFFVLRWAWSRWNERKGQRKPSDEPPPTDD